MGKKENRKKKNGKAFLSFDDLVKKGSKRRRREGEGEELQKRRLRGRRRRRRRRLNKQ